MVRYLPDGWQAGLTTNAELNVPYAPPVRPEGSKPVLSPPMGVNEASCEGGSLIKAKNAMNSVNASNARNSTNSKNAINAVNARNPSTTL